MEPMGYFTLNLAIASFTAFGGGCVSCRAAKDGREEFIPLIFPYNNVGDESWSHRN